MEGWWYPASALFVREMSVTSNHHSATSNPSCLLRILSYTGPGRPVEQGCSASDHHFGCFAHHRVSVVERRPKHGVHLVSFEDAEGNYGPSPYLG